jgi:hypothetical protein
MTENASKFTHKDGIMLVVTILQVGMLIMQAIFLHHYDVSPQGLLQWIAIGLLMEIRYAVTPKGIGDKIFSMVYCALLTAMVYYHFFV